MLFRSLTMIAVCVLSPRTPLELEGTHSSLYLALPGVELSHRRVAERVVHGGHAIAAEDIARRFPRSLRNLLEVYAPAVDAAWCFLNSESTPNLVFTQQGERRTILDQAVFDHLVNEARP